MSTVTTFQQFLQSGFSSGPLSTDEVVEFVLPLFEEVLSFHQNGQVGPFDRPESVFLNNNRLDIDENFAHSPSLNLKEIEKLLAFQSIDGYSITEKILVDEDVTKSNSAQINLQICENPNGEFHSPVFLPGYQCYEIKQNHHDAQTDIFCLGLILGSAIMGLDLYDLDDLNKFVRFRVQPAGLNERIHPTLCGLVTEMTELDRAHRSRDLQEIIQRLKFYRDFDPQREADLSKLAAFQINKPSDRKSFILSKLKNRLFDTSRRNRLLYYKPNARFVNLTVSSVPLVLHYQSVNPNLLFTWNSEISKLIIAQGDVSLNKYLRFEDHPYLNSQLNSIRQIALNDEKEFGFSQLKLVVAFLHWHNLKDDPKERIQSPLLLLPVEIDRKKSLKEERFTLRIKDNVALINPILSNYLKDLYGIELPESIDFDDVSMFDFFKLLESKISEAKAGVKLNYIDKPRIKIIHSIARQTVNNYRKKLKLKNSQGFHQIDYSYSEENYKPLGLELFRQKIEPRQSKLEFLLSDTPAWGKPESLASTDSSKTKATFELTDGENNPYSWDFDICNIVLGNFNYKKMSLVGDYNKVSLTNINHPVFDELFTSNPKTNEETEIKNIPTDWYHVISADPTQAQSILHSRSGKSYVIQGPPGTGKSQTITNLIADFLSQGKSILFICEKRAALDVVHHRLEQNKLAELCCYIHDSQGDKKPFYKNLKIVYEDFLKNKMDLSEIETSRNNVLQKLTENLKLLSSYHDTQNSVLPESGLPTRKLIEKAIELKDFSLNLNLVEKECIPGYSKWLQFGESIKQVGNALLETGAQAALSQHPFSNLGTQIIKSENPFSLLDTLISQAHTTIQDINSLLTQQNIPLYIAKNVVQLKNLIEDSLLLEPLANSQNLELVDKINPASIAFESAYSELKQLIEEYSHKQEVTKRWKNKFDRQETESALALAKKHEKAFLSFLNSNWRRVKRQIIESYDFSAHQIKPAYSLILTQLIEEHETSDNLNTTKAALQKKYNVSDIQSVYSNIETLRKKQGDPEVDFMLHHPKSNELVQKLSRLNKTFLHLEAQLDQCLYSYKEKQLSQINDELSTIRANYNSLKDLLPSLRKFSDIPTDLQDFIRNHHVDPIQAEATIASKTIENVLERNQFFLSTNNRVISETIVEIEKLYNSLLILNSDYIRAKRRNLFLQKYELSNTSVTVLNNEQRLLKKRYTDGRRVIEHEMDKQMRFKSIREIASNDSGLVLKDIKPVWLMSPLSVSDSLPLDPHFFDVVIFDEASQITLEEGIPSLFRAPQTIIVGDDKQMPPSNFFTAKSEDPEDLETIDGETEDEILSSDSDSLLVQGSRKLKSTMLSWHYRSRYETLISYSNHAFYDASLLTIPDRTTHHQERNLLEVLGPEEGLKNAPILLSGSISFHYMPNSVYDLRSNIGEAKYIAQLIRKLLLDGVQDTIGVVAFSQEQQGVIEDAIDELASTDKPFEELLEKAFNRKDDGQFTGLFIKNLENVQGDERDIIIMSICYGPDTNKKILMNFGPINRKGGEKRLNVIFSRARKHMAVVSSLRHYNITNDYNDGANYLKKFLQYSEMISTGNLSLARTILDSLIPQDKTTSGSQINQSITTKQLKLALETLGYIVNEQIGQSSFKCTLGVKKNLSDDNYLLGILVDDDIHYLNTNIMEQYYQRPAILKSFGWKTATVFGKDWLADKAHVLERLKRALNNNDAPETNTTTSIPDSASAQQNNEHSAFTRLKSIDGTMFWEIAQNEQQLIIRQGREGYSGQTQIKSFSSTNEASIMKLQFIEDYRKNGYL